MTAILPRWTSLRPSAMFQALYAVSMPAIESHELPALTSRALAVALSLRPQLLPDPQRVPVDEHDRMLDAIVHPDQVVSSISSRWVS